MRTIKRITAREIFRRVPKVKRKLWGGEFWTKGYFMATVGRHSSEEVIWRYVERQGRAAEYTMLHEAKNQLDFFGNEQD